MIGISIVQCAARIPFGLKEVGSLSDVPGHYLRPLMGNLPCNNDATTLTVLTNRRNRCRACDPHNRGIALTSRMSLGGPVPIGIVPQRRLMTA
jgi:hypothetical protein